MKGIHFKQVVWFFLLPVLILAVGGLVCVAAEVKATKFDSNGDLVKGWYWLRDSELQQYAEWTFMNVPSGTGDLVLVVTALATDRINGRRGLSARFRLLYGFPGSGPMGGVFTAQEITLPNVSPPNDPVGYTCQGEITIPRSALHGGSFLFLRVERISPTDNHVAFNKDSIVIPTPGVTSGAGGQNDAGSGGDAGNDAQHAYHINLGTSYQGFLKHPDDDDYYSFDASAGQIISVSLAVSSDVKCNVYLFDPNGSSRGYAYATQGSPGKIEYVAGRTGTWIIRIHRSSGEGTYTLTLAPPSYQATDFQSTGNLIDSWSWLQDNEAQQFAEWTFEGIAPTTTNLSVMVSFLASGIAAGTTEVHVLLIVGLFGATPAWSQEVSIPVIGPATGTTGVLCQGSVQIPVPPQYVAGQSALAFQLHRISADSPKIAVKRESIVIAAQGVTTHAELQSTQADDFRSNGELIQKIYWCRRQGQFLEWTWNPNSSLGQIDKAAVNFELLVTNKVNGGSGWGTTVQVALLDLAGNVITTGNVELVNPFRPQFPGDSHGIGYKTYGVYALPDPNLVRTGFRIRISWPPSDGSSYHFGGAKDRALLAVVVKPSGAAALPTVQASDILSNPQAYVNKRVKLAGEFHGWQGGLTSCPSPVSRNDWLVGEGGAYIYATGPFPHGLNPWDTGSLGKKIVVIGTIRLGADGCPYIEVESARELGPGSSAEGMSRLTQCLDDIPIYPGAVWEAANEAQIGQFIEALSGSSIPSGEVKAYVSSDSPAAVVAFYRQVIPEKGWKESLVLPSEKGTIVIWEKGRLSLQLFVTTDQDKTLLILGCGKMLG